MAEAVRIVIAEPLTPAAFEPFGQVLEAGASSGRAVNQGTARRFDHVAALESARPAARPNLALFRCAPQGLPFAVRLLERHPHSTQAFVPLACARWLVCVAPALPDGAPDADRLRAFLCGPRRGINLARGVWHHPMVALDHPAELAMLAWEDGTVADGIEHPLAETIEVREPRGA